MDALGRLDEALEGAPDHGKELLCSKSEVKEQLVHPPPLQELRGFQNIPGMTDKPVFHIK